MKCHKPLSLSDLACAACGSLQPLPADLNAYDLLGIDVAAIKSNGWQIDLGELKALWRKRVALSHPDRMGGKDHKEQQIAAQQSALINKAYETLREPLQRAHLLLEKHSSAAPSESDSLEDPEVLMEVMELREDLEGAVDEEEAEAVRQRNKVNLDQAIEHLKAAFDAEPVDVEKAKKAAVGLRYWTNIDKAAREWQPGKPIELLH
ncbi:hypothetical protein CBS101457_001193 [Exobasidium rhododendri]|nr:hypothetical protein CBS101457_001193 [Exobasidium rhododendri]